ATSRARGLRLALESLAIAGALETLLLLRAARRARSRLADVLAGPGSGSEGVRWVGRAWTVGLAVLIAMLGFSLMAAFLAREG
ncbi:MAG: hypothetical protein M3O50_06965, partial [Myxococcota bacterium]|nr:hypothetical protein [Myxococcota bacterium]